MTAERPDTARYLLALVEQFLARGDLPARDFIQADFQEQLDRDKTLRASLLTSRASPVSFPAKPPDSDTPATCGNTPVCDTSGKPERFQRLEAPTESRASERTMRGPPEASATAAEHRPKQCGQAAHPDRNMQRDRDRLRAPDRSALAQSPVSLK
jgi:hypothetical protein